MSHAQLKARVIKRADTPQPFSTIKEHQLGVTFETLDRLNGFKRLYESDRWIVGTYEIPRDGVIPSMSIFDPTEGDFIQAGPRIITDKCRSQIVIRYERG